MLRDPDRLEPEALRLERGAHPAPRVEQAEPDTDVHGATVRANDCGETAGYRAPEASGRAAGTLRRSEPFAEGGAVRSGGEAAESGGVVEQLIVDADTHLTEPPDVWTSRVSRRFVEHVPHVERNVDGKDVWVL